MRVTGRLIRNVALAVTSTILTIGLAAQALPAVGRHGAVSAPVLAGPSAQAANGQGSGGDNGNGNGPKPVEPSGPLSSDAGMTAAMTDLETKANDHFWWGLMLEIDYKDTSKTPGEVVGVGAFGDSGLWSGTYLAAESFRYATARDYLSRPKNLKPKLTKDEIAFWQAQKAEAKTRIDKMVAQNHVRIHIAREWQTEFSPSIDPAQLPGGISFGGGVIKGEPGMLMRSCAPDDDPSGLHMSSNKRVFGPWQWTNDAGVPANLQMPETTYVCETAPSRDTYAGTTFGMLTAFDLVSADDPAMRAMIASDVQILANFLVKNGWTYPRPHGNVSLPPFGHDFDNFVSPLFPQVPLARLNMIQAARHVAEETATAIDKLKWEAVWAEELATQGPILAGSMQVDAADLSGYYPFNLHHLTFFNTIRLESDPAVREIFRQALSVLDNTTGDDLNAHFEAITYALTGEDYRRDAAVQHVRDWLDYRARIDLGGPTTNSTRCGVDLTCIPNDQTDLVFDVAGQPVTVSKPGTATKMRATTPLPIAQRPPTDFLWQRVPQELDGYEGFTHRAPGIDFLLPYWMIRYYTEVKTPDQAPLPVWIGPASK
ncbi:MAG: hypothetical protein WDA71_11680 [Actinomycetota bacterium]